MKQKLPVVILLLLINFQVSAEYNLLNNNERPTFIEQGYRNVLNSSFLFVNSEKVDYLNRNKVNIPFKDFLITFNPKLNNDNKVKGKEYYFTNYDFYLSINGKNYKLPFIISDVSAIGSSILYNDENLTIFSIESYINPVSNNDSKKFKSDIYFLNKNNLGLYNPLFLTLNSKLKKTNDIPLNFSKLTEVKYNKKSRSYQIKYELQQAQEDFNSTGKIVYEKSPIEYSFTLVLDQKDPFLIRSFIEKRKGNSQILSKDDRNGMYSYFLK